MLQEVEHLGALQRRLDISVPTDALAKEVSARLAKLARSAKMPGFRPGKVPMKMIASSYGAQVQAEVLNDKIGEAFNAEVAARQLRVAGTPTVAPKPGGDNAQLTFSATFEIYPDINLKGLEGLELNRPSASVTDADVDAMIESLRKQRPDFLVVERACGDGDRITIDFEGTLDGEPFDGGKAEGHQFVLGQGRMLKDFEDGVRGAAAGETRSIDVVFPADYPAKNLAGQTARFEVTVKSVEEVVLPEVDEAFCKAFGVDEGGVDALRAEVRDNMERELGQAIRSRLKAQVMDKLLQANPLDLPSVLVEQEIRDMQIEALRRMGARSAKQLPPRGPFEANARRRVALGLLLNEAIRKAGIELDGEQVKARLDDLVSGFEDPTEANALLGAPSITLEEWFRMPKDRRQGLPH